MLYYPKNLSEAPKYIFSGVNPNSDLVFLSDFTLQPKHLINKIAKFALIGRIPVSGRIAEWLSGYKGYTMLSSLHEGDRLLLNGVTNVRTIQAVKWLVPKGVRLFNYFNNCLRFLFPESEIKYKIGEMKKMGVELMTFDPQEAIDFGLIYTEQFYRFPVEEKQAKTPRYDFFFCGEPKDRLDRIQGLKTKLESMGYRCLFIVSPPADRIRYEQYIEYVKESACVVDIINTGQVGLTRRPIEALFFNKKLLTENSYIVDYDFYRASNTFIIGKDSMNELPLFMNTAFEEIPRSIKEKYEVNNWLKYFK